VSIEEAERKLEEAILEYERATENSGVILTSWVLVAEFIDGDGYPSLSAYAARGMPYWRIDGLLDAAPSAIPYAEVEDD
jgi:hypothetical protein